MRYYFLSIFLQIIIPSTAPQKINTGPARLVYVSVHIHIQEKTQAIINAMITRIISLFISSPCNSTWKLILQEFTKFFWDNVKNYFYFITLCLFLQICCFTLYCNCICKSAVLLYIAIVFSLLTKQFELTGI